ncbi:hypothetical protein [Streptomyces sp. NPDC096152]
MARPCGLKARVLDEKYNIERLSAAEEAANEQVITFEAPCNRD